MGQVNKFYKDIPWNEYLDLLISNNDLYTLTGSTYPNSNMTYRKWGKTQKKKLIYKNTYIRLANIVVKMFKWKTPKYIDARQIELGFLFRGMMCLFTGAIGTYMLPCIPTNRINIYGNPQQVNVIGWDGFHKTVNVLYPAVIHSKQINIKTKTRYKGVFVRDNDFNYPYINYITEYANKIADKIVALDIATQRLKSPFIFMIRDIALKDTVEKLVDKIESNDDLIIRLNNDIMKDIDKNIRIVNNNFNPNIIQAIKDSILFDFDMFLETIGINTNPSPDKSQVVLTPEINSNNSLIDLEQDVRFLNRVEFAKNVKELMGIDIEVEKNVEEVNKIIEQTKKGLTNDNAQGQSKETR